MGTWHLGDWKVLKAQYLGSLSLTKPRRVERTCRDLDLKGKAIEREASGGGGSLPGLKGRWKTLPKARLWATEEGRAAIISILCSLI